MTDGNDFSGIGHDRVGIKVRLDTLGLHADLAAQLLARTVIEIDDSAPVMRMCLMPKVEQVFDHIVWNPALLQPCLRVMGHRQHDSSPIRGQWNERYRAGGSPDAPGERSSGTTLPPPPTPNSADEAGSPRHHRSGLHWLPGKAESEPD